MPPTDDNQIRLDGTGSDPIHQRPDIDQTTKKPTREGWLFCLQINDLPESDVERAMGIENVEQGMVRRWRITARELIRHRYPFEFKRLRTWRSACSLDHLAGQLDVGALNLTQQ